MKEETFSSRWALLVSVLGIAVGTGNIWRFSRIVAQNGGGSFLIPWIIFLFIWSVPLIILEFTIGKYTRKGPIGAFVHLAGERFAWMGAFMVVVSTAIMFYYSVVTGWCIKYLTAIFTDNLLSVNDYNLYWNNFSSSYQPIIFHFISMIISGYVVLRGVKGGIEKVSRLLVPSLVLILILLFIRALTLPGAIKGIEFFFKPDFNLLLNHKVWIQALTQNAWDTGAGWGLILVYAAYAQKKEDTTINGALVAFGNNSISLLAGMTIFATVFALTTGDALKEITISGPANTGLTFISLPNLFRFMPGGFFIQNLFTFLFFLALSFAALTSLISLVELATKTLIDFGLERKHSILIVLIFGLACGLPSSLNLKVLINQDWVWGVALILSGGFLAFAVMKFGVNKFREEVLNDKVNEFRFGKWFNILIKILIPIQVIILLFWWISSSFSWEKEWYNPFKPESAGTAIFQWAIVILILLLLNKKIASKLKEKI
ncbi:MAG: sodium-dependent transporter [Ignavibacterium sp.]|nr:sodium-dependent transporter [Ignavibacterium sp.]